MSEFLPSDTFNAGSSADQICDPTVRREHYKQIMSEACSHIDDSHVPDIILRLQDSWSEIRKDCAKWIRLKLSCVTPGAEKLLFDALIECIGCGNNCWQAVHGSLLGITELIRMNDGNESVGEIVQSMCLDLVGSSLAPVREAATACISKLVTSNHISTAVLVSTILSSITKLYGNGT